MQNLNNKPEFLIAAIIILTIEAIFLKRRYYAVSKANKVFYRYVVAALVTACFDLGSNVAEAFVLYIPEWLVLVFRAVFFSSTIFTMYFGFNYFMALGTEKSRYRILDLIMRVMIFLYSAFMFLNVFTHWMMHYENGERIEGPLFSANYVGPAVFVIYMLFSMIMNKIKVSKVQLFYIITAVVLAAAGAFVEWLMKDQYILVFFAIAIGITVMLFGLETPDYKVLVETLEALENSKAESEIARADADAANDAKTTFLARMSHEIRTPINGILGMNEMILRENKDPQIHEYSADIKRAAHNLLSIVNDILDFSKIDSGKMQIIRSEYKLSNVLHDTWNLFEFPAREKNLNLVFDIDENIPEQLYGDDIRLKQILSNLISNAVKYTDKGTVTLSIREVAREDENIDLAFLVKDTGRGIKPENIEKLCLAFERIDEKNNRTIEGTGLGMSIVSKTLELLGSRLSIRSVFGEGSEFGFVLRQLIVNDAPIGDFMILKTKANEKGSETAVTPFKAPNAKILVVDDNLINLKVFTGLLKNTEICISEAQSGEEALKCCEQTKFNLIFLDHLMPGMDGLETFDELRKREDGINIKTPVVCLTANAMQGARDNYIVHGFDDALFKPIDPVKLFDMLKRILPADLLE